MLTILTSMSDLHRIIEAQSGVVHDTFDYLATMYFDSPRFEEKADKTKRNYKSSYNQISKFKTKQGTLLGQEPLVKWNLPLAQKLVDNFTTKRGPTSANQMARFCKMVFNWGQPRGHADYNPFLGIEMAKERKRRRLPKKDAYSKVLEFSKTTPYEYLWIIMELAYLCRLRGIEVLDITDENEFENGLFVARRKGSRSNIIEWNKRLTNVWKEAKKLRKRYQEDNNTYSSSNNALPIIFGSNGKSLHKEGFDTAWQRMIKLALKQDVIEKSERFSLHDLKRMGVTDTKGTRADKQQASGHRSAAMMDIYDFEVPVVTPAADNK